MSAAPLHQMRLPTAEPVLLCLSVTLLVVSALMMIWMRARSLVTKPVKSMVAVGAGAEAGEVDDRLGDEGVGREPIEVVGDGVVVVGDVGDVDDGGDREDVRVIPTHVEGVEPVAGAIQVRARELDEVAHAHGAAVRLVGSAPARRAEVAALQRGPAGTRDGNAGSAALLGPGVQAVGVGAGG